MTIVDQVVAKRKAWRRELKKIERFQNADVVVVSNGKSGRTWLRTLISSLYHQRYGVRESELIHYDNFHRHNTEIPRIHFTDDVVSPIATSSNKPISLAPEQKLILLTRDPRDIAVSFYFQIVKRSTAVERLRKGISEEVAKVTMFDFVVHDEFGIPGIIRRMNGWQKHLQSTQEYLQIKYEGLRVDPIINLGRVAEFIGGGFTMDQIQYAVEFASFESLQEKERQGFFESNRLRPTDKSDPDSFKVRRGKVGGHRDYFTSDQLKSIDDIVATQLNPAYGYASARK